MISKKIIKAEINKIQDSYIEILYRIIKAFEINYKEDLLNNQNSNRTYKKKKKWHDFINETYGCLTNATIERGKQGKYEIRTEIVCLSYEGA